MPIDGIQRGRSLQMGIKIEAEIVWLVVLRDGLHLEWRMYGSVDQALRAAGASASPGATATDAGPEAGVGHERRDLRP
jgi:hypothetical protein